MPRSTIFQLYRGGVYGGNHRPTASHWQTHMTSCQHYKRPISFINTMHHVPLDINLFVHRLATSNYLCGISKLFLWPLYCLSFDLRLLITPAVSSNLSFGHYIVCPSNYGFYLPLQYLQTFHLAIVLSVRR